MSIWRFQADTNFTPFHFTNEEDSKLFNKLVEEYFEESKSVIELWKEFSLKRGEPKKHPDFFEIENSGILAISEDALGDTRVFFSDKIELLPIHTDAGLYYVINVLNIIDAFDKEESEFVATPYGQITDYFTIYFHAEKIKGQALFKIPELPYDTFVSGEFLDYCDTVYAGLEYDSEVNLIWYD